MNFPLHPSGHRPHRFFILAFSAALVLLVVWSLVGGGSETVQAAQLAAGQQSPTATPAAPPSAPPSAPLPAQGSTAKAHDDCTLCHSLPHFTGTLLDSSIVGLTVDPEASKTNLHTRLGTCGICHKDYDGYPHKNSKNGTCTQCHFTGTDTPVINMDLNYHNTRELTVAMNNRCFVCHETVYMDFSRGMHAENLNNGNLSAPLCSDCHGSHDVQKIEPPIATKACDKCHDAIYTTFMTSVHGADLAQAAPGDAPTCADCHGSHTITGPRDPDFRKNSVAACLKCHEDKVKMGRYGVEADIFAMGVDTYHNVALELFERKDVDISGTTPVCYDCHGIHAIRSVTDPASRVSPSNLRGTCHQCHPSSGRFSITGSAHIRSSSTASQLSSDIQAGFQWVIPGSFVLMLAYTALDARKRWMERRAQPNQTQE